MDSPLINIMQKAAKKALQETAKELDEQKKALAVSDLTRPFLSDA